MQKLSILKLLTLIFVGIGVVLLYFQPQKNVDAQSSSLSISNVSDNRATYTSSSIPMYEKLEISFQLNANDPTYCRVRNCQLPYATNPPAGLQPGMGVNVDAIFTDPSGAQFKQPAFYFQDFEYQVKTNRDWLYPTNNFSWKVRFAPNKAGSWKYRLTATDATGTVTTQDTSFTVVSSSNKGFIRVSKNDKRYFEYEDGTYFPALGYNMTWGEISWENPVQANKANFTAMSQNGIQLIRTWLAPWGIYSSLDNPWASMRWGPDDAAVDTRAAYPGSDVSMKIEQYWEPCPFYGGWKPNASIKPNKKYKVFMRYLLPVALPPIKDSTKPNNYGVVAKLGYWLDSPGCGDPSDGTLNKGVPVTSYVKTVSPKDGSGNWIWQTVEGSFDTSTALFSGMDTLPRLYIAMENVDHNVNPQNPDGSYKDLPRAYIDRIEVHEDATGCAAATGGGNLYGLTNGSCGPDILAKSWMAQHQYMSQELSYRWDLVMEEAKKYGIYFKLQILEKNEKISNWIDYNGNVIPFDIKCWDSDPNNNPALCPGNNWFYGNWGQPTKTYWLQQAWWRYLQARWGYSTQIHSWELLNEGDPFNGLHYSLADNFAKYMHQFTPNWHMVTTSMWTSLPFEFWADPVKYPNIDYADVHQYITEGSGIELNISKPGGPGSIHISDPADFYDSAAATQKLSMQVGAKQTYGTGKPIMRGETGFVTSNSDGWTHGYFVKDTQGVWLHNYVWASINSGGLMESYWYAREHIYPQDSYILNQEHYPAPIDLRPVFKPYYEFIKNIPINNGRYVDSAVTSSNPKIRVWGQKDLPGGRAHLWIQNIDHTWKNVVDNVSITAQSGTVTIPGFIANRSYQVQWWNTYTGTVSSTAQVTSNSSGVISLAVSNLTTDTAVQISDPTLPSPTAMPTSVACGLPGDLNCSGKVDSADLLILLGNFGKSGVGDINNSGKVDSADLLILLGNFGK